MNTTTSENADKGLLLSTLMAAVLFVLHTSTGSKPDTSTLKPHKRQRSKRGGGHKVRGRGGVGVSSLAWLAG